MKSLKKNAVTLKDIASELNLSTATVSRALTRPELIAQTTVDRVREAVEKHGYRPNRIARSLRTRSSLVIGLIVSDIQNPFYAEVVKAVEAVVRHAGYNLIICNADEDPETEASALRLLSEAQVAGLILASTGTASDELQQLQWGGLPIVEIDRTSGLHTTDTVLVDNAHGARLAARHLVQLGHRDIATIAGPQHLTTGSQRLSGFRDALADYGCTLRQSSIFIGNFRSESGYDGIMHLFDQLPFPTAVFVANNEMLAGALAAISELGLNIPSDVSIVSFDDVRWAQFVNPPLTVVAQPTETLGTRSAELLLHRINRGAPPTVEVLEPHLIVRQSCAAPKIVGV